jgi:hypothetical protein
LTPRSSPNPTLRRHHPNPSIYQPFEADRPPWSSECCSIPPRAASRLVLEMRSSVSAVSQSSRDGPASSSDLIARR